MGSLAGCMPCGVWPHQRHCSSTQAALGSRDSGVRGARQLIEAVLSLLQTSTWRCAEMVDGRCYGRVPETSLGGGFGAAQVSFMALLTGW